MKRDGERRTADSRSSIVLRCRLRESCQALAGSDRDERYLGVDLVEYHGGEDVRSAVERLSVGVPFLMLPWLSLKRPPN